MNINVKGLLDRVTFGATVMGLEQMLEQQAEDVTPGELWKIIDENKPAVLSAEIKNWAVPMYQRFQGSLQFLTIPYILKLISTKRPDLFQVIATHPSGAQWCNARYTEILAQLNNSTLSSLPPPAQPIPSYAKVTLPREMRKQGTPPVTDEE
jgi:hypothetical protein